MVQLSIPQIAAIARDAGFSTKDGSANVIGFSACAIATALAYRESCGQTDAVNPSSGATGLWQIYPPIPSKAALMDPRTNARKAYAKYVAAGKRWTPWKSVYDDVTGCNGMYLIQKSTLRASSQMLEADAAVRGLEGKQPRDPGVVEPGLNIGIPNPLEGIAKALGAVAGFFSLITQGSTWVRILLILLGVGLGAWAVISLASETDIGKAAIGAASKAAVVA